MGTRLGHGRKFVHADVGAALAACEALRPALVAKQKDLYEARIARGATEAADAAWLRGRSGRDHLAEAIADHADAVANVALGLRRPDDDFEVEVAIVPSKDGPLGLPFIEDGALLAMFGALWTSLPYWDNTDPPEGTGDEAWAARRELWLTALGPTGVPADVATIFAAPFATPALDEAAVVALAPGREARVARLAKAAAMDAFGATRAPVASGSDIIRLIDDFEEHLRGEGRGAYERHRDDVGRRLPRADAAHLRGR